MSTHLNITYNLFGLSSALGLEKQAATLLRGSLRNITPTAKTLESMRSVAQAPRVHGAMSPTKMSQNIATNRRNLADYTEFGGGTYRNTPGETFINDAYAKAVKARKHTSNMLSDYQKRIASGTVDALDPATAARLNQLQIRQGMLNNSVKSIGDAWSRLNA